MDDARAVRLVERVADLDRDRQRLVDRERAACRAACGERLAFEILQDEEVDAVLLADVEQRADVRVAERRDRARLALEALAQLRIAGERRGQDLDRDHAIEPGIARPIHFAHAARADEGDDFVGAELCPGRQRHGLARL